MCWLILGALALGLPLEAADPTEGWNEPFVVRLEVYSGDLGRRLAPLPLEDWLVLEQGAQMEVDVVGIDQHGRSFPADRFAYELELDWRCHGVLELRRTPEAARVLVAGSRLGECHALLTVAGNMNLDRELFLRVGTTLRQGFSRRQAEWTVQRLYEAILGREADDRGLAGATALVQRGDLDTQVRAMYASNEYRVKRALLSPAERLEDLYRALLGREPDSRGQRAFLEDMVRGRQVEVTLALIKSQEFERRILREAGL